MIPLFLGLFLNKALYSLRQRRSLINISSGICSSVDPFVLFLLLRDLGILEILSLLGNRPSRERICHKTPGR
jgi:hypothetical protein